MNVIGNFTRKHFPHKTIINVSKYDFWQIYDSFMGKMFPHEVSNHIHKCVWKLSFLMGMTDLWQFYEHEKNSFITHLWKMNPLWQFVTDLWKWQIYDSYVMVLWHIYDRFMQMTVLWQFCDRYATDLWCHIQCSKLGT